MHNTPMSHNPLQLKLAYVPGLLDTVRDEIPHHVSLPTYDVKKNSIYMSVPDELDWVYTLKSVSRVYLVRQDPSYHPVHIFKHKSILGDIVEIIVAQFQKGTFKTFSISCAGAQTKEIKKIKSYIEDTFGLELKPEADLKIHIAKTNDMWEVGAQLTPRPLSTRSYRTQHLHGAMDATIAYTLNQMCDIQPTSSYLNVCSGSATLLLEAALSSPRPQTLIGFDTHKHNLSLSIQNIKKAGLLKDISIKEADLFDDPDFGMFDVITSDLPFGMVISKGENLTRLYSKFIEYAQNHLNPDGVVGVYTSEFVMLEKLITASNLTIRRECKIDVITSQKKYLPTKILILGFA